MTAKCIVLEVAVVVYEQKKSDVKMSSSHLFGKKICSPPLNHAVKYVAVPLIVSTLLKNTSVRDTYSIVIKNVRRLTFSR